MSARPTFRPYDTRHAASQAAAEYIATRLRDTPGPVSLALSGGSSPSDAYLALLDLDVPWERLWIVWVDERCVPHTHADSNVRAARKVFLNDAPIDESRILEPPAASADDPAGAALTYQDRLHEALGADFSITVAVMGMGDDGHTASLFPGADFEALPGDIAHTLAPPTSPVLNRLTLTLQALDRAQHAVYLVFGKAKSAHVQRVSEGEACPAVPAACVLPQMSNVWFVDAEAAPVVR